MTPPPRQNEPPSFPRVIRLAELGSTVPIPRESWELVHRPLLSEFGKRFLAANRQRLLVLLAGPPGSGKSTLAAVWQALAGESLTVPFQALPMDGFHLPNAVLDREQIEVDGERVPLRRVKGAPETFDLAALWQAVAALAGGELAAWPAYDRQRHEPVAEALHVIPEGIVLVEGNYLLLDEPGWRELPGHADLTIFLDASPAICRDQLLRRFAETGRTPERAREKYEFNDRRNCERVIARRLPPDVHLRTEGDGQLRRMAARPA